MDNTKMISLLACFVIIVAAMNGYVEAFREFKVGDEFGWQVPEPNNPAIYTEWATSNRFHVGDSLSFEYQNDSVVEVDKWGYYHCNRGEPMDDEEEEEGKSIISLDRPGPFYFISGDPQHCKKGQRLIVEVMGLHSHSPPSISMPPEADLVLAPSPLASSSGPSASLTHHSSSAFKAAALVTASLTIFFIFTTLS